MCASENFRIIKILRWAIIYLLFFFSQLKDEKWTKWKLVLWMVRIVRNNWSLEWSGYCRMKFPRRKQTYSGHFRYNFRWWGALVPEVASDAKLFEFVPRFLTFKLPFPEVTEAPTTETSKIIQIFIGRLRFDLSPEFRYRPPPRHPPINQNPIPEGRDRGRGLCSVPCNEKDWRGDFPCKSTSRNRIEGNLPPLLALRMHK